MLLDEETRSLSQKIIATYARALEDASPAHACTLVVAFSWCLRSHACDPPPPPQSGGAACGCGVCYRQSDVPRGQRQWHACCAQPPLPNAIERQRQWHACCAQPPLPNAIKRQSFRGAPPPWSMPRGAKGLCGTATTPAANKRKQTQTNARLATIATRNRDEPMMTAAASAMDWPVPFQAAGRKFKHTTA